MSICTILVNFNCVEGNAKTFRKIKRKKHFTATIERCMGATTKCLIKTMNQGLNGFLTHRKCTNRNGSKEHDSKKQNGSYRRTV